MWVFWGEYFFFFFRATDTISRKKNCPESTTQYSQTHSPYPQVLFSAVQFYTLKSKLFSVHHCKAGNNAWGKDYSVATYTVDPHSASRLPIIIAILSKSGKGRHAHMCEWPHPLTQHMGRKHCKLPYTNIWGTL